MKNTIIILSFVMLNVFFGFSQETTSSNTFFGQCLLNIDSQENFLALESKVKQNPYVKIARFDWITKRVFILTQNTNKFDEQMLQSWLQEYAESSKCIQIGVYGVDQLKSYPFEGCK